ncbi:hypothetical protein MD484_g628, partial [Candolleomyces efflorescens]
MFASLPRLGEFSQPFKRAQFGLFGGKTKQYGNNVPFSKHKTRRSWLPNVQTKRLPSETLGEKVKLKVTTRALRTIKKAGGLDAYLKQTPAHKLSHEGMRLRLKVKDTEMQKQAEFRRTPEGKNELEKQRGALGVRSKIATALFLKTRRIAILLQEPTLEGARKARQEAAKALGLSGLASAEKTMAYISRPRL